jgi:hypothetical protein
MEIVLQLTALLVGAGLGLGLSRLLLGGLIAIVFRRQV